jgi:hypothetical protein
MSLPALIYDRSVHHYYTTKTEEQFDQEPPIKTIIDSVDIKDRIMEYLGAVLARCWFDKNLLHGLEHDAHKSLRHIGILLPDELDVKIERKDRQRPKLVIYEWNKERSFKRRICYLQMIMLAGR